MCGSMVYIQSSAAEIRRGNKKGTRKIEETTGQKYNVRICCGLAVIKSGTASNSACPLGTKSGRRLRALPSRPRPQWEGHTHTCLGHQAVSSGTSQRKATAYGWEGIRRSGLRAVPSLHTVCRVYPLTGSMTYETNGV